MHIIITGGTGMAGEEVMRQALIDKEITMITLLVRKKPKVEHAKIHTILMDDFSNYIGLEDTFKTADACIWCLGISQTQVSKEEYAVITYDYTIAAANAMYAANPGMTFVFLSGQGADSSETSRILFARIKGKTENALKAIPFKAVYIARPGGINPVYYKPATTHKKFEVFMVKLMARIMPSQTITTAELALAMLQMAKHGAPKQILENKDLKLKARKALGIK